MENGKTFGGISENVPILCRVGTSTEREKGGREGDRQDFRMEENEEKKMENDG